MTTSRRYTLLVPRLDRTGPVNVAVDVGRAARAAGWEVTLLFLSGGAERDDFADFAQARKFRFADLFTLRGVVHTHCLRPDLVGALMALNSRCTIMTTLHNYFLIDVGFDHKAWKVRIAWEVWKRAIARMDHRVCISNAMRRYYRRVMPRSNFDLAYNFRPALEAGAYQQDDRISAWMGAQRIAGRLCMAYVGGLNKRKNVLALIEEVGRAPELALLICGQGPLKVEIEERVKRCNLGDRVLLAGQVQQPAHAMSMADLLVLPSFAEGLPLVAIEAARLGIPCLLSNIAVHRELAALGLGLTFQRHGFRDFRAKAHAIADLATAERRQKIAAVWRSHFSPEAGFACYRSIIEAHK